MQFPAPSPAEKEKHYTAHLYTVHVYVYIYDYICICSRFDRIYFWPKFGLNRLQIVFFCPASILDSTGNDPGSFNGG